MEGKKFGMMTILNLVKDSSINDKKIYLCKCECGTEKEINYKVLRNKTKPRSCGCSRKINAKKIFESNFEKSDGCWEWKGSTNKQGYGKFRSLGAHRAAYEYYIGKIPKGKLICHKCDNPKCINPDHLFIGTHKDNSMDMAKKFRGLHGTKSKLASLNEKQVLEIRKMRLAGKEYNEIKEKYNVCWGTIASICKNRSWKHVPLGMETKKMPQIRRVALGEKSGSSKLTEKNVLDIRERLSTGEKGSHLAKEFNVDPTTISDIKHRNIWKNI